MKIRRFLSVFLLTLLLTGLFCVPQASAVEMPQVNAKAALLMDYESGRMLYGLNEKDTEYLARSRRAAEYCAAHLGWAVVHCTSGDNMRSIEDIQAEVQKIVLKQLT